MLKKLLITILLFTGAGKTVKAQFDPIVIEAMIYYFGTYDEINLLTKVTPSLNNTYIHYGIRGGHSNARKTFTAGMAFYYAKDNRHPIIPDGKYTNYYGGLFLEFKVKPRNKLYFSIPLTLGGGSSELNEAAIAPSRGYNTKSAFWIYDQEVLLNYRLGNWVHFYIGPGFKLTSGSTTFGMSDQDLSGFAMNAGLRIGNFE